MSFFRKKEELINSGVILKEIFTEAKKLKLVDNSGIVSIPELNMSAESVTTNIFYEIDKIYKADGERTNYLLVCTFCMFAGIGAVLLWESNWPYLRDNGIFETLKEPKGVDALDDYVMELLGLEDTNYATSTKAAKYKFMGEILATRAIKTVENNFDKEMMKQFQQIMIAMYNFGVAYGAEFLGMK